MMMFVELPNYEGPYFLSLGTQLVALAFQLVVSA